MELKDIDIGDIIPQRPPFQMVDRLLSYDETVSEATLLLRADNIFLDRQPESLNILPRLVRLGSAITTSTSCIATSSSAISGLSDISM